MSHYMTALAMKQRGLKPAAKIVLYWLADHHNGETGACFPSLKTLEIECEMNRSAIVRHLNALEEAGLIERIRRTRENGSQTSTAYVLRLTPVAERNTPCCETQQPPVAKRDPHNLGNNNLGNEHTPLPPKGGRAEANEIFETLCAWASPDAATSFIAYRKRTKGKALTLTAAKRLANNLKEIFNAGGDTDDALGLAEERGWQSIKPEWYFNDKQRADRGSNRPGSGMAAAFAAVAARSTPRQG
jgi:DNA-binding MarR family transcriptional regulator